MKEQLEEFVEWCKENTEDVFDIYHDTDSVIDRYLQSKEEETED